MIELKIDSTKNELSLTHDVCCNEHLADELAIIIDIMIADYFIKNGHNDSLVKLSQIKTCQFINLFKSVYKSISVYEKLS